MCSKKEICDVSIVCANYNNGKYLDEFISSVINSSALPKELIIIDDGSTDESLKILSRYNLPYLKVIALKSNVGFANALNVGIKETTGKYILRVDPDDILEKTRIAKQYTFLEKNSDIDITGSNVTYFNEKLESVVGSSNFPQKYESIYKRYIKGEHGLLHGTVMGKSLFFKKYLYCQSNVPAEDYDIFSRMIKDGVKAQSFPDKLTFVRIHQNSVSNALPFSTIKKTYALRDKIFKTKTSFFLVVINYLSLKYYRKYYFEKNNFKRVLFLGISGLFRPDKVIKKFLNDFR
ncbi:glycosyltransferase family 2 protein [Oceanihabitans sp. IOP_32]|uniref:glycosyltransferase family 2 protein n=1 Tax=Oceanihabitans sp. IOP_32 TaxID=2529032 RepID=UPI001292F291|nr:glycosyltransferase family 2 protein [Oceanihabitans sp. IOP_32]QFZ54431.1 glycosyltransferase family 2 protein [Oceanihabitans sp. IOP_32]